MTDTVRRERSGGAAGNEITGELQGFYLREPFLQLGLAALKPL